ncbi:hypothetical protein LNP74_15250 [Klebsiella pneumoniae subsp. pneumoniae]|nr:hypothetical protein [Klebsiella pneumoniae subsp. pneumoniae]
MTGLIFAGLLLLAVVLNCFIGVMASSLPAMFPTHIRFSALASAFNISVLIAGLTPTLAAWLVETTQKPDDAGVLPDGLSRWWVWRRACR